MNAVHEVMVKTVDSGAAKSVRPIRKNGEKGVTRIKATKTLRLAAANGSPTHVEQDAIGIRSGRREVQNKVLGC